MLINSNVLLIGNGRMAKHLKHWNSLHHEAASILTWNRTQSIELLESYLNQAQFVWLAISDSAIIPFYEKFILGRTSIKTVHFSGALNDSRLLSAHPLMSFPLELLPDEIYAKIHFVINNLEKLSLALPGFNNSCSQMPDSQKALYHALCVVTGNFPQMIWSESFQELEKLNIPPQAFELYIKQITENFIRYKADAVTGPIARNDISTIDKNIASLHVNQKLHVLYKAFFKEFHL